MKRPNRHFTSSQIIILGFAAAILLGSLLNMRMKTQELN